MKAIWTGTDALFLVKIPKQTYLVDKYYALKLRLWGRLVDYFAKEHYACGEIVARDLKQFGMKKKIKLFVNPILYPIKIKKKTHEAFNILYYCYKKESRFNRWIYGYDIFEYLKSTIEKSYDNVNFIMVDGNSDMNEIYSITDLLIRPNRHDGEPRMVIECNLNEIPVIATKENPDKEYFLNEIIKLINK